jgi:hypothetical protein
MASGRPVSVGRDIGASGKGLGSVASAPASRRLPRLDPIVSIIVSAAIVHYAIRQLRRLTATLRFQFAA